MIIYRLYWTGSQWRVKQVEQESVRLGDCKAFTNEYIACQEVHRRNARGIKPL